jgi:hypothetical protein
MRQVAHSNPPSTADDAARAAAEAQYLPRSTSTRRRTEPRPSGETSRAASSTLELERKRLHL